MARVFAAAFLGAEGSTWFHYIGAFTTGGVRIDVLSKRGAAALDSIVNEEPQYKREVRVARMSCIHHRLTEVAETPWGWAQSPSLNPGVAWSTFQRVMLKTALARTCVTLSCESVPSPARAAEG